MQNHPEKYKNKFRRRLLSILRVVLIALLSGYSSPEKILVHIEVDFAASTSIPVAIAKI